MSRLSLRVTVIDVDLPAGLAAELEAWLSARCPTAIIEVRRTVTSDPKDRLPPAA